MCELIYVSTTRVIRIQVHKHTHSHWFLTVYFRLACVPVEQVQLIMSALLDLDSLSFIFRSERTTFGAESLPLFLNSPCFSSLFLTFPPATVALLCCCSPFSILLFKHLHLALSTSLPPSLSSPLTSSPSSFLFIYAEAVADAAPSLSQKFMWHRGCSQVL